VTHFGNISEDKPIVQNSTPRVSEQTKPTTSEVTNQLKNKPEDEPERVPGQGWTD